MLFELENLVFQPNERFRLEVKAFSLDKSEKVAIVGQNGSGKTTLLRLLVGLEPPTSCGKLTRPDMTGKSSNANGCRVGFLKQAPYIFRGTVESNLAYPMKLQGMARDVIAERVRETLELIDLSHLGAADAHKLSGGEQKRLALGRVLISKPDLLILDEPGAHLDKRSQRVIGRLMAESSATILFTTHDLFLAHRIASRVLNLKAGRVTPGLPENILTGAFSNGDLITTGGMRIHLPSGTGPLPDEGAVTIMLDPRHLVISLEELSSSMRNHFHGRICSAQEQNGSIWMEIDCGELLTAIISQESYTELGLNLNREVVVSFKAQTMEVL